MLCKRDEDVDAQARDAATMEMLTDAVAHGLTAPHPDTGASFEHALRRLLLAGGASTLLAGVDAVREVAARGESRAVALEAFVWALTREPDESPAVS